MRRKINKIGEEGTNNFGSKMIISRYNGALDIDIYFPEYDWTSENKKYQHFKNGKINCPYEPRVYGKGYLGEGIYKKSKNGKLNKYYISWCNMLKRCYDPKLQEKEPSYKGCEVEKEFLNFQIFSEWFYKNYYEVPGERMDLDKDILCKGNKIYSRDKCIFVPQRINSLFVKRGNDRGKDPIGMSQNSEGNYRVRCRDGYGKRNYLGIYSSKEDAFRVYKEHKERIIKEVIDSYEGKIPEPHYSRLREAMYNYKVEIDD